MIYNIFLKIMNISIYAGFLIMIVALLRLILKRFVPRRMMLVLWALVAIRLILPVSIDSSFGFLPSEESLSYQEALEICNMPDDMLREKGTDELFMWVVNYPFLGDTAVFDSAQQALSALKGHSNICNEFFSRSDSILCMLNYAKKHDNSDEGTENEKAFIRWYLETIYPTIVTDLSQLVDKKEAYNATVSMIKEKYKDRNIVLKGEYDENEMSVYYNPQKKNLCYTFDMEGAVSGKWDDELSIFVFTPIINVNDISDIEIASTLGY